MVKEKMQEVYCGAVVRIAKLDKYVDVRMVRNIAVLCCVLSYALMAIIASNPVYAANAFDNLESSLYNVYTSAGGMVSLICAFGFVIGVLFGFLSHDPQRKKVGRGAAAGALIAIALYWGVGLIFSLIGGLIPADAGFAITNSYGPSGPAVGP